MGKKSKKTKLKSKGILGKAHKSEVIEEIQTEFHYEVGHFVVVKKGVPDPDYNIEIGGWRGKIYDIESAADPVLSIEWDHETQRKMGASMIKACEKDDLDHTKMSLLASEVEPEMPAEKEDKNRILLKTMTQETYMLARIHYDLFDKEKIQLIFSKLRCMAYDIEGRWVWLYEDEAKKLKFEGSYYEIPKERRPIVLGSFYSKKDDETYLNVNSFDRAKKAVVFFDKYIPRTVAMVTDIEVVNKIFGYSDGNLPKHEDYFDKEPIKIKDTEKTMNELENIASSIENPSERLEIALTHMENSAKEHLPEVERFPIHFYEDGIMGLDGSLKMRETIALQHWSGNKDYTFYDLMQEIIPKMPPLKMK